MVKMMAKVVLVMVVMVLLAMAMVVLVIVLLVVVLLLGLLLLLGLCYCFIDGVGSDGGCCWVVSKTGCKLKYCNRFCCKRIKEILKSY